MNEFEFINKYFKPLTSKEAQNLTNDAALYKPKLNTDIVISTDTLAEGIHFFGNENPRDIAKKCLRVNLSDMAAMGAKPVFYNLSISVPKNKANIFIPAFAKGLKEDQEAYNIKLIGGDLTASLEHINITITIFGEIPSNQALADRAQREVEKAEKALEECYYEITVVDNYEHYVKRVSSHQASLEKAQAKVAEYNRLTAFHKANLKSHKEILLRLEA